MCVCREAALERDGDTKTQRVPACSNTAVSRYLESHYKLIQTWTHAEVQVRLQLPAAADATPTCLELAMRECVRECVTSTGCCDTTSCFFIKKKKFIVC